MPKADWTQKIMNKYQGFVRRIGVYGLANYLR
jgi:hypothetical protein